VNVPDEDGTFPLMVAARSGLLDFVKWLAAKGADVRARDLDEMTAAIYAKQAGRKDIEEFLVKAAKEAEAAEIEAMVGQPIDESTFEDCWTPLMRAAAQGRLDLVEQLVENGADVNEKTKDGWTALLCAADSDSLEIIEFLQQHGATEE
jgi:ankyrin repeat protein